MSSTQKSNESAIQNPSAGKVDMKLEVVTIPVSDVDRAKRFYLRMGWRLDADFAHGDWRIVQVTPPGSACSFFVGKGITKATPGSVQGLLLMVDDVDAARAELRRIRRRRQRGVPFRGRHAFHRDARTRARAGSERRSYSTFLSFDDPDGNGWVLQEIKTRFLGEDSAVWMSRRWRCCCGETEEHHGAYEGTAPKHHWSDWYAAYIVARERGQTPERRQPRMLRFTWRGPVTGAAATYSRRVPWPRFRSAYSLFAGPDYAQMKTAPYNGAVVVAAAPGNGPGSRRALDPPLQRPGPASGAR